MYLIVSIACSYSVLIANGYNFTFSFFHGARIAHLAIRIYGWNASISASISEELSCQREVENYTDPFVVVVMKDNNSTKMCCNIAKCTVVPGTFIGINFHEIVLPCEKSKN